METRVWWRWRGAAAGHPCRVWGCGGAGGTPGIGAAVTRGSSFWNWPSGNHFQLCLGPAIVTAEGNGLLQEIASIFNFLHIRTALGHTGSAGGGSQVWPVLRMVSRRDQLSESQIPMRWGENQRSVDLTQPPACGYSSLSVASLSPEAGFLVAPNLLTASHLLRVHHPTPLWVKAQAGSTE